MEPEIITHKTTKLVSEYDINLNHVANSLRERGYVVRTKQGGSLLLTAADLPSENSITITKKNAYIENASLNVPEIKSIYEIMRADVLAEMTQSLEAEKEKFEIFEASPRLGDSSAQSIIREMMTSFSTDALSADIDDTDIFSNPKQRYIFKDPDGKDYISFSMGYTSNDNEIGRINQDAVPIILVTYGPEYGDVSKTFEVSKEDLIACSEDNLHNSDISKRINKFTAIGKESSEFIYRALKCDKYDQAIEKVFKEEFKHLDREKAKFFADLTKAYYRINSKESFACFMLNNMDKAPFYKASMQIGKGAEALSNMFQEIERKIQIPDLPTLKLSKVSLNKLSYFIEESGQTVYDSKVKEPVQYDKEWITKLAGMQDKLIDLRNGPVQDMLDTAKNITRGIDQARRANISIHNDGVNRGTERGNGFGPLKDGLNYSYVLHNLKKEYQSFRECNNQISAYDKKIDIKLYCDDIMKNADIYVKAAAGIRDKVDNLIDLIGAAVTQAKANIKIFGHNIMTSGFVNRVEDNFMKLGNLVVDSFNELSDSFTNIGNSLSMLDRGISGADNDILFTIHEKSSTAINDFKEKYNDIIKDAKIILSSKEYAKECIAETINDLRIEQSFPGVTSNDFSKMAEARFWCELDYTVKIGQEAEKIPSKERSGAEKETVWLGKQAAYQKKQNLFIAEHLHNKIKEDILNDNQITPNSAIELLAAEYHQSAMAYNIMNGAVNRKAYQDLSDPEKDLCKHIIALTLKDFPNVTDKLADNLNKIEMKQEKKIPLEQNK